MKSGMLWLTGLALLSLAPRPAAAEPQLRQLWQSGPPAGSCSVLIGNAGGIYLQDSASGITHLSPDGEPIWQRSDLRWNVRRTVLEYPGVTVFMSMNERCWGIDDEGALAWEFAARPWQFRDYPAGPAAAAADFALGSNALQYGLTSAGALCWMLPHTGGYGTLGDEFLLPDAVNGDVSYLRDEQYRLQPLDRHGVLRTIEPADGARWPTMYWRLANGNSIWDAGDKQLLLAGPDYMEIRRATYMEEPYGQARLQPVTFGSTAAIASSAWREARLYDTELNLLWKYMIDEDSIIAAGQLKDYDFAVVARTTEAYKDAERKRIASGGKIVTPLGDNSFELFSFIELRIIEAGQAVSSMELFGPVPKSDFNLEMLPDNCFLLWQAEAGAWCFRIEEQQT